MTSEARYSTTLIVRSAPLQVALPRETILSAITDVDTGVFCPFVHLPVWVDEKLSQQEMWSIRRSDIVAVCSEQHWPVNVVKLVPKGRG